MQPLQPGDVVVSFLDRSIRRAGQLWSRIIQADTRELEAVQLRWIPRSERLFGNLESFTAESGQHMVLVDEVEPGSPAEGAGLLPGDRILKVGGVDVERPSQAWEDVVLAELRGGIGAQGVSLEILRRDQPLTLALFPVQSTHIRVSKDPVGAVWFFLTHFDSRFPEIAGILSAIFGSIYIVGLTALLALPIGVGAAIFLQEYGRKGRLSSFIELNIANLAGVPSVVYGIIGLEVFARGAGVLPGLGRTIGAGALTMSMLIMPIIIINAREALKAVPNSMREAAYAVGATRWQVVRHHVVPYALPGVLTGVILAMSRAIGETAPLILLGAFLYVAFVPDSLSDVFTVLPIQIFSWTSEPQDGNPNLAAAAILTLLGVMLAMNALAILLRNRYQLRW